MKTVLLIAGLVLCGALGGFSNANALNADISIEPKQEQMVDQIAMDNQAAILAMIEPG
ncbi:MAG: hypothetical protein KTR28_05200 [Micavibrio sp.]|nr:hypothetical protein [Micavibrio sp.]